MCLSLRDGCIPSSMPPLTHLLSASVKTLALCVLNAFSHSNSPRIIAFFLQSRRLLPPLGALHFDKIFVSQAMEESSKEKPPQLKKREDEEVFTKLGEYTSLTQSNPVQDTPSYNVEFQKRAAGNNQIGNAENSGLRQDTCSGDNEPANDDSVRTTEMTPQSNYTKNDGAMENRNTEPQFSTYKAPIKKTKNNKPQTSSDHEKLLPT